MATRKVTITLDVADGPHDVDDTIAEWGATLYHTIEEAWGETDDDLPSNAIKVLDVRDETRGLSL